MIDKRKMTIARPDDWHLHLRDGATLRAVLPFTSANFARAIIMPNLVPPVVTSSDALSYRNRILDALPGGHKFEPLMTLYLTESTDPADLTEGVQSGLVKAVKLYPAGATTNSESGVRNIENVYPVLERMVDLKLPLLCHGEVTDPAVDIFDREAVFIERVLDPLRRNFPELRVVMEHLTTGDGVDYVRSQPENLAATITCHHLIINRNALFAGGIRPDYYCLPIAKREHHRRALVAAATSGDKQFFLGTDSAPHPSSDKYTACGCAGIFTSINALSCLAHIFEDENALQHLEAFISLNGPEFYKLPPNHEYITLFKSSRALALPSAINTETDRITVFDPGFELFWQAENSATS